MTMDFDLKTYVQESTRSSGAPLKVADETTVASVAAMLARAS